MYRLVWCLLVSVVAVAMQVSCDNSVLLTTTQPSVEELRQDGQELREDEEQPTPIVEDLEHGKQIHVLLTRVLQEMQQKRAESHQAIEENLNRQTQGFTYLIGLFNEVLNLRQEIVHDRMQVSKWQSEMQASITTNQIETANILNEVLEGIETIQAVQNRSIEWKNNFQEEVQNQQNDKTTLLAESQQAFSEVKEQQNETLEEDLSQTFSDLKSELSKLQELNREPDTISAA
uniref:Putative secreted protein n=1 Tax=Anopheles triannulatus TaxID=58253 RepID=A0A2M4B2I6_9DIPT